MLPEQASGAVNTRATPAHGNTHPLADTASQVKHDQTSSDALASGSIGKDQPAGSSSSSSRQPVALSEELTDLFDSIQQLQQEMAALPQPQQISPVAGAQSGPSNDQVPIFTHLHTVLHLHSCTVLHLIHTYMMLHLHSRIHSCISWDECQGKTPQL